jgi:hypothetical protein
MLALNQRVERRLDWVAYSTSATWPVLAGTRMHSDWCFASGWLVILIWIAAYPIWSGFRSRGRSAQDPPGARPSLGSLERLSPGMKVAGRVDEAEILLCRRRGTGIDLVLDRSQHARSQFVFTKARRRPAVRWQT